MIIPNRIDLPNHVSKILNEQQMQDYFQKCLNWRASFKCTGQNTKLYTNSYGEFVLIEDDKPQLIIKPKPFLKSVYVKDQFLRIFSHACEVQDCDKVSIAYSNNKRNYKQLCHNHYQDYLKANYQKKYSNWLITTEIKALSDLNGHYYAIGLRKSSSDSVNTLMIDDDDLDFIACNRPLNLGGLLIVKYKTPDGKDCTSRLSRVLLARALYRQYDHRLISPYLQVSYLDHNPKNLRIHNLRQCTAFENYMNGQKFDKLKANNKCHGYGVKEIKPNEFEIKAYRLNEKSIPKRVEVRYSSDLQVGLAWKYTLEEKLLREIGVFELLTPPIQFIEVKPVDTNRKAM